MSQLNGLQGMTGLSTYKKLTKCLCCDNSKLEQVIDLGHHALANSFTREKVDHEKYPLVIKYCPDCTHYQLSVAVSPDILFRDYCYVSGTTQTLRDYFRFFAYWSIEQYRNWNDFSGGPKTVLDIACNDGSLLDQYKDLRMWTYGIDPAENLYRLSSKNHSIVCDYLTDNSYEGETFDIVTAQNVLAHTAEPLAFLRNCKRLLSRRGVLFIQTSQSGNIDNGEVDYFYHEHISSFTYMSMKRLAGRVGLQIIKHDHFSIHGTSQVFQLTHITETKKNNYSSNEDYRRKIESLKDNLLSTIATKREEGYHVIGYGAAAKGMTLLGYLDLNLDYIIDDNQLKIGTYAPVKDIPVVSRDILLEKKYDKILFIPLAWNFFDEIRGRIKEVRNNDNDLFIKYFPEIQIIS